MTWWQAILLGALQGVTEFLPISSSGHLVLAQHFLGFEEHSEGKGAALFFDGMLHVGTVVAVLIYFRKALPRPFVARSLPEQAVLPSETTTIPWPATWSDLRRLGFLVVLASLPAALATVLLSEHIKLSFSEPGLVAVNFLVLGVILFVTDWLPLGSTTGAQVRWWQALIIGVGQALSAVFRGLSRSGMTVCAGVAVGLERDWAVRFSFMMSVVASLGLGGLGVVKALGDPQASVWLTPQFLGLTALGTAVSAGAGYLTIAPLIALVQRCRLWWFSIYLWLVGAAVLAYLRSG